MSVLVVVLATLAAMQGEEAHRYGRDREREGEGFERGAGAFGRKNSGTGSFIGLHLGRVKGVPIQPLGI